MYPTLCNPMYPSWPGSSVRGILQERMLWWEAIPFSRGIFPTQRLKQGLPHCRQIVYLLSHQGINYFSTGDSLQNGNSLYREPYHKRKDAWTYIESSDFLFFFLWCTSNLIMLWSEKMLDMIPIFLSLPRIDLWPKMWSILENVPCSLEKKLYFANFG